MYIFKISFFCPEWIVRFGRDFLGMYQFTLEIFLIYRYYNRNRGFRGNVWSSGCISNHFIGSKHSANIGDNRCRRLNALSDHITTSRPNNFNWSWVVSLGAQFFHIYGSKRSDKFGEKLIFLNGIECVWKIHHGLIKKENLERGTAIIQVGRW